MQVYMTKKQVQAMIKWNAWQITELEELRAELKKIVNELWHGSDPLDDSISSKTAFEQLNLAKNELRAVRKKIKMLAEVQNSLKKAVL